MAPRQHPITQAWLESLTSGVIELRHDWRARHPPPLAICREAVCMVMVKLAPLPEAVFGHESGYFVDRAGEVCFYFPRSRHPDFDPEHEAVYLVGDFNQWTHGIGQKKWRLVPGTIGDEPAMVWRGSADLFQTEHRFKFATDKGNWLPVPPGVPNEVRDEWGNVNRQFDATRTGRHLFGFRLAEPLDLTHSWTVGWGDEHHSLVPLRPGAFFYELATDHPLGAVVEQEVTVFRLFAPRAQRVELALCEEMAGIALPHRYALDRRPEADGGWRGTWEIALDGNLHGWFYWYSVAGPADVFGSFRPELRILDPYALATVERDGPGIVVDRARIAPGDRSFRTPAWQDLVIAEAHVRDLVAHAPVPLSDPERLGFAGLTKWVESPGFYLSQLGVNAVELQPVQEFDNQTRREYHWGYMPNAWFAPEAGYSLDPARASGIRELQDLVRALHQRGLAVILDVVYNHVGEPAHLLLIDRLYYFEIDSEGQLTNWSGCGNDLRCRSAMARRLIADSLVYLVETFGVDGFRFDLAELIGREVLVEVERRLKQVKPDIILIAEPWSFRGHIAGALRDTGYASWNDGYRNFLRDYVRGGSSRELFEYYLRGSPWYFAKWPAQTVNYTESHDDRTWIDQITENASGNGHAATERDRRRTHLMAAILFSSIGIPMLAAGQDFLRSKQGANNTYLRGDLNALDYRRLHRFPGTHAYFAAWIAFRRSEAGRLLRHYDRSAEGFFRFFFAADSTAAAVVYNADRSQGGTQLLFAVNPTSTDVGITLDDATAAGHWHQLADAEVFRGPDGPGVRQPVERELFLPALGCGLWAWDGGATAFGTKPA
jgi:pullulanase